MLYITVRRTPGSSDGFFVNATNYFFFFFRLNGNLLNQQDVVSSAAYTSSALRCALESYFQDVKYFRFKAFSGERPYPQ